MRTCRDMGIKTVAIYSDADSQSVSILFNVIGFYLLSAYIVAYFNG